jgi:hypothetical protein
MSRTLMLCRLGLAGAATVAVLTACGGSGGSTNAASSTSVARTTSSSAATTAATVAAGGGGAFCDQARAFASQVASSVGGLTQKNGSQALQTLVAQLQSMSPPAEIAADWRTALGDLTTLAQALANGVPTDAQGQAALEQKVAPAEQELTTAGDHIDQYLQTKCGINVGDTASATS